MKYIFFTYNLLTLCRAIRYTDSKYGKSNVKIVYSDFVSKLPVNLQRDYDIKYIESHTLNNGLRGIKLIINSSIITNKIWKTLDIYLSESCSDVALILFRDNELQETTWINRAVKKYGSRVHIWLMEEGAGLYASQRVEIRYKNLKRMVYAFMGVSCESLQNYTQGMNPKVEKVICTKPIEFLRKRSDLLINVEQMIDIFVPKFNDYIIGLVLGDNTNCKKYDFVFLTQPFHDFRNQYEELLETHKNLLPQVFDILRKKGKTVIKLHPREQYDYKQFTGNGVELPSGPEQQLPFECLMQLYGNPQMISMFSSVSINIQVEKPSIFLGELFGLPVIKELFDVDFYKENNIVSCKTLEEVEQYLEY